MNIPHPDQELDLLYGFNQHAANSARRTIDRQVEAGKALLELAGDEELSGGAINLTLNKPRTRLIAYLLATGKSNTEIAEIMGLHKQTVGNIARGPECKSLVKNFIDETGKDAVKAFLATEVMASIETAVAIRDNTSEKGVTRLAAVNTILDRALGKPTLHVETTNSKTTDSVIMENEALEAELASVNAKLKASGASLPN